VNHYPQLFCSIELSLLLIFTFCYEKKERKGNLKREKKKKEKSTY